MSSQSSVRDAFAQCIITESIVKTGLYFLPPPPISLHTEADDGRADNLDVLVAEVDGIFKKLGLAAVDADPQLKVGIVGAGVAGLYTAMILQSLNIPFDILEADSRVGGRLRTHKLGSGPNDYYDAGAMRFPNNPLMRRTFNLFKRLDFTLLNGKLGIYHMGTSNDKYMYNDIVATKDMAEIDSDDVFRIGQDKGGTVPPTYVQSGTQHWIRQKIGHLRAALKENFEKGWVELMKVDMHSMRSYMANEQYALQIPAYPNSVINWCETREFGTIMYDAALSEIVLESLDFDYYDFDDGETKPAIEWVFVQGGAEEIAKAMVKKLKPENQPQLNKRVKGFYPRRGILSNTKTDRSTTLNDGQWYRDVILTIEGEAPVPTVMACGFSYALKEALRTLRYDASVKVAIKFTSRWWEQQPYNQKGGKSLTDRPTRVIVYPSYGVGGKDAVLLASYTWSQDALRFGSLVRGKDSEAEKLLVERILRDIADLFGMQFAELKARMIGHHAYDWYQNEFTAGAFAMFGPGQFRNIYPEVTKPACGGLLHFAGEATSANHAWVVGALNSAYRCVEEMLIYRRDKERLKKLKQLWAEVGEVNDHKLAEQVILGTILSSELCLKFEDRKLIGANANE